MAIAYPTLPSGAVIDSSKFSTEIEDNTLKQEVEGGYAYTRPRTSRRLRRKFKIGYTYLTNADKAALEALYQSAAGGARAIDWTSPQDLTTYTVRFEGTITFDYRGAGNLQRWDCSFEFVQV